MFNNFQSSYALGLLLFPGNVPLQLGLFFTGKEGFRDLKEMKLW